MIKLASLALMSLCLSLATVAKAQAAAFTFTQIADNTTNFSNFGLPVLNNSGSVAFRGVLKTGESGIFKSNSSNINTIATTNQEFSSFSNPSINDLGTVAYSADLSDNSSRVLTSNGSVTSTIATGFPIRQGSFSLGEPSINNFGTVAFSRVGFNNGFEGFIDTVASDGKTSSIKYFSSGTSPVSATVSINDAGSIAYLEQDISGRRNRISLINNNEIKSIAGGVNRTAGFSLNNQGTVAYGFVDPTSARLGKSDGVTNTIIAERLSSSSSNRVGTIVPGLGVNVSINDLGTIALTGTRDSRSGIYLGKDEPSNLVIGLGDSLFGSTISSLSFSRDGLNNSGQLAFFADFTDGKRGIFLANPVASPPKAVSEPWMISGIFVFGAAGLVLSKKKKSA
ncbi:MAG: hypothetical protein KME64_10270 [Scytonematopsis contorta HA4267-MV1]|jgi:hypothetical protein|nr:hypothetical protein [Scytonematopsis contorta HA4267-MV1]